MSRYIDADVFMKNLKTNEHGDTDVNQVEIAIDKSRADVVEAVRCKDCIFNNDGWCGADHLGSRWIESEDYCSFGERREHE